MTWTRVHAQEEISSLLPRLQGNSHKLNDLRQDLFVDPTTFLSQTIHAGVRLRIDLLRISSREDSLISQNDLRQQWLNLEVIADAGNQCDSRSPCGQRSSILPHHGLFPGSIVTDGDRSLGRFCAQWAACFIEIDAYNLLLRSRQRRQEVGPLPCAGRLGGATHITPLSSSALGFVGESRTIRPLQRNRRFSGAEIADTFCSFGGAAGHTFLAQKLVFSPQNGPDFVAGKRPPV